MAGAAGSGYSFAHASCAIYISQNANFDFKLQQPRLSAAACETERVGFEPTLTLGAKLVFETSSFSRSDTSPSRLVHNRPPAGECQLRSGKAARMWDIDATGENSYVFRSRMDR